MSKKNNSLLIAFGAVIGAAAAAGLSYYLKYKHFNDEVDQDFHDYEEDEVLEDEESTEAKDDDSVSCADAGRTYITLGADKAKAAEEETVAEAVEEDADDEIEVEFYVTEEEAPAAVVEEDTEGAN